jgi:hypothetical protein
MRFLKKKSVRIHFRLGTRLLSKWKKAIKRIKIYDFIRKNREEKEYMLS